VSGTDSARSVDGSTAAAISKLVVRLVSEYTGRGPTRARTYLNENLITVVLQDSLTQGERSLLQDGRHDLVLAVRHAFQEAMRADLITGVEELTKRTVSVFLSANHTDPDIAVETFMLVPDGAGPSSGVR